MNTVHRKLLFYKSLLIFLMIGIVIALLPANIYLLWNSKIKEDQRQKSLPHYRDVMRIIKPLEYSGLHIFMQKNVYLTIDFDKKEYTLHNVHSFAPDGKIILEEGRYGLCGELSIYVYQNIQPIFKDGYSIKFLRVLESGFFFEPKASHVVLLLKKKGDGKSPDEEFMIDPTFHRYGRLQDFDNYFYLEALDRLKFDKEQNTDLTWSIDTGAPLLIKNDHIVVLNISGIEGKFSRENFAITVITANKNKYANQCLFSRSIQAGNVQQAEDRIVGENLLTPKGYHDLTQKIVEWGESI